MQHVNPLLRRQLARQLLPVYAVALLFNETWDDVRARCEIPERAILLASDYLADDAQPHFRASGQLVAR